MPFDGRNFEEQRRALDKIDQVINLLSREERWCKGKLRMSDGRLCIVGALQEVHATVELTKPIMVAIRQVARERHTSIEAFNDHRATTHARVLQVLHQARENVRDGIVGQSEQYPPPGGPDRGWFRRLTDWAAGVA